MRSFRRRSRIVHAAGAKQLADGSISQVFEFVHAAYREVFYGRLPRAKGLDSPAHRRFRFPALA